MIFKIFNWKKNHLPYQQSKVKLFQIDTLLPLTNRSIICSYIFLTQSRELDLVWLINQRTAVKSANKLRTMHPTAKSSCYHALRSDCPSRLKLLQKIDICWTSYHARWHYWKIHTNIIADKLDCHIVSSIRPRTGPPHTNKSKLNHVTPKRTGCCMCRNIHLVPTMRWEKVLSQTRMSWKCLIGRDIDSHSPRSDCKDNNILKIFVCLWLKKVKIRTIQIVNLQTILQKKRSSVQTTIEENLIAYCL